MVESFTVLYICDGSDKEGMRRNFDADVCAIKAAIGGVCTSWAPADAREHLVSGSWKFDAVVPGAVRAAGPAASSSATWTTSAPQRILP